MKVLIIGGTGNLSLPVVEEALAQGLELVLLNRGREGTRHENVETLVADAREEGATGAALAGRNFDVVVDFIAYGSHDVDRAARLFLGRTDQYVYISSASVYRKPPLTHLVDERTPLDNPYWQYSRDKIAGERALAKAHEETGFPFTIVRPSHTYGRSWIPTPFGSSDFTLAGRMLAGKEVPVPGDGQALWTITHARDFAVGLVGLLGRREALGEAFTVAGDESLTWDEIYRAIAASLGVEPRLVHVPVDVIAKASPDFGEKLLGDKAWTSVFDCSKLKRLVPAFATRTRFAEGVAESLRWLMEDETRRRHNPSTEAAIEAILAAWKRALVGLKML